jgi:hypothetical protein
MGKRWDTWRLCSWESWYCKHAQVFGQELKLGWLGGSVQSIPQMHKKTVVP